MNEINRLINKQQRVAKKLTIVVSFTLIAALLMSSATYAWLTLSRSPEVSGIKTNIGANGSLEMALLSRETYLDPSRITSTVGSSIDRQDPLVGNVQWGSVVDLSSSAYGLGEISLKPSRLAVLPNASVEYGLLCKAEYTAEGRVTAFNSELLHGIYSSDSGNFIFSADQAGFGVRGIGTSSGISSNITALANARVAVRIYSASAKNQIIRLWEENGPDLVAIMHYIYGDTSIMPTQTQCYESLTKTANNLLMILDCFDSALRQAIIGYSASIIDDAETFEKLKTNIENKSIPLAVLLESLPVSVPVTYREYALALNEDVQNCRKMIAICETCQNEGFTKEKLQEAVNCILSPAKSYINTSLVQDENTNGWELGEDNIFTIQTDAKNQTPLHTIAEYIGDYSVFFEYDNKNMEVTTLSTKEQTPILQEIAASLDCLEDNIEDDTTTAAPLNEIYGFALDMAFRCNTNTELLLQTFPRLRVDGSDAVEDNLGAGSFMTFASDELSDEQMLQMMDAIRIGFLDHQNNLLGMAKLNTSNYESNSKGISARLYLYEYNILENGSIQMGERCENEATITVLDKNEPAVVTIVVWLDGDAVSNSMASICELGMTGMLNLQFSCSADLNPVYQEEFESAYVTGIQGYYDASNIAAYPSQPYTSLLESRSSNRANFPWKHRKHE